MQTPGKSIRSESRFRFAENQELNPVFIRSINRRTPVPSTLGAGMPEADVVATTTACAAVSGAATEDEQIPISVGADIVSALRDASIRTGTPDSADDNGHAASTSAISQQVKSPSASPGEMPITKADGI